MPLYEYRCSACGESFEIIASLAERDEKSACPACGSRITVRLYSPITLAGRRTSIYPESFVRPHGPVAGKRPAQPRQGEKG